MEQNTIQHAADEQNRAMAEIYNNIDLEEAIEHSKADALENLEHALETWMKHGSELVHIGCVLEYIEDAFRFQMALRGYSRNEDGTYTKEVKE